MKHLPVLLGEVLKFLDPKPGDFIIDGTVGSGGHMLAIAEKIGTSGNILGIDLDQKNIENLQEKAFAIRHSPFAIRLLIANYADLPDILQKNKLPQADGLLIDLGFSSVQMDGSGRGFSFKEEYGDEKLLMTYDSHERPVHELLRELREEELADIIYRYGEERMSRQIAKAIKEYLRKRSIETAGELARIIEGVIKKRGKTHPATRTFQALRIYTNHELENLKALLDKLPSILKPGGRAAIISFHSLEDRIVKNTFRDMAKQGIVELLTKKPIVPSRRETIDNPRSRSAKLRAIRLL